VTRQNATSSVANGGKPMLAYSMMNMSVRCEGNPNIYIKQIEHRNRSLINPAFQVDVNGSMEEKPCPQNEGRIPLKNFSLQGADYQLFKRKAPGTSDALSLPASGSSIMVCISIA
jgi:hypothetical protein